MMNGAPPTQQYTPLHTAHALGTHKNINNNSISPVNGAVETLAFPKPVPLFTQTPPVPLFGHNGTPYGALHHHHHRRFPPVGTHRAANNAPAHNGFGLSAVSSSAYGGNGAPINSSASAVAQIPPLMQTKTVQPTGATQNPSLCAQICGLCAEPQSAGVRELVCGHKFCGACLSEQERDFGGKCPCCGPWLSGFNAVAARNAFNGDSGAEGVQVSSLDNAFSIWEPLPFTGTRSLTQEPERAKVALTHTHTSPGSFGCFASGETRPRHRPLVSQGSQGSLHHFRHASPRHDRRRRFGGKCGCEEKAVVLGHCVDCNEDLCGACVLAHARVKITKQHRIQPLEDAHGTFVPSGSGSGSGGGSRTHSDSASLKASSDSPSSCTGNSSVASLTSCPDHDLGFVAVCGTCAHASLCVRCLQQHAGHEVHPLPVYDYHAALLRLVCESKNVQRSLEDTQEAVKRMTERVDASVQAVAGELQAVVHLHISALEERKREMLQRFDTVRNAKLLALKQQQERLHDKRVSVCRGIQAAEQSCLEASLGDDDDTRLREVYEALLCVHCETFVPLVPTANDSLRLRAPDPSVLQNLRQLGRMDSGLCPAQSRLIGARLSRATTGRPYVVNLQMRDACGEAIGRECREQGGEFVATLFGPLNGGGASLQHAEINEREHGVCSLMFTPKLTGVYRLCVTYCQVPLAGTPMEVQVCAGRDYRDAQLQGQKFCFGSEGTGDGQLSRPWGICCDNLGRILVADRSNHRVQIFDGQGRFLAKFGSKGQRAGEFNRPAGLCVNPANHIIVADKDNHRVQVFFEDGRFSHTIGSRGTGQGYFHYPWGVAANAAHEVAVTDTRNHRIQIFAQNGTLLRVCMLDVGVKRPPSAPRGICFLPDGELLVSDFNVHRLAVLSNSGETRFFGAGGTAPGRFFRPQGVTVDADGLVLVCDSRGKRIQVLNLYDFTVVAMIGNSAKGSSGSLQLLEMEGDRVSDTNLFHMPCSPTLDAVPGRKAGDTLEHPMDVCVSPDGLIYVVDFTNNCIRVY